ncbi:MAG: GTPase [Planctomycetaceae bacterium]
MISARSIILSVLISLPIVIFAAVGGYAIWQNGNLNWIWWLMTGCAVAAWGLSKLWKTSPTSARKQHHITEPTHWTPRDRDAAEIVRNYQLAVESHTAEQLTDPHFYLQQVQSLAMELARLYHPKAADPLDQLTVPEVLAAIRLAGDDMERWMLESVPGSRMLTIRHWQLLQSAPEWANKLSEATWVASVLLNPANIVRYLASRWTWGPVSEQIQSEVLAVVYLRFIRQVGYYLIEMNSGRLRGGADAYRAAFGQRGQTDRPFDVDRDSKFTDSPPITISLVGQVSSGKSSLINRLTGQVQAAVDILPETKQVQRYQYSVGQPPVTVTLLDTPGYGESGASKEQIRHIQQALEVSDAALLVMDAHSPAREADRVTLEQLREVYASQLHLKPPPVVGVLTHVDLLSPPLEWSPPYDWRTPASTKAKSLHDAVDYTMEVFKASLKEVVPVCTDAREERQWGVTEELLPVLAEVLEDAAAVSLLRAYESQLDRDRWRILLKQVASGSQQLVRAWIDERLAQVVTSSE